MLLNIRADWKYQGENEIQPFVREKREIMTRSNLEQIPNQTQTLTSNLSALIENETISYYAVPIGGGACSRKVRLRHRHFETVAFPALFGHQRTLHGATLLGFKSYVSIFSVNPFEEQPRRAPPRAPNEQAGYRNGKSGITEARREVRRKVRNAQNTDEKRSWDSHQ